jgi:hypothetical protein
LKAHPIRPGSCGLPECLNLEQQTGDVVPTGEN